MKMLTDLFTTDYGLMTVVGISFMLGMGAWFWFFSNEKWLRMPTTLVGNF
jgi:hypothetical protein